jgi:hypothetical protein
MTDDYLKKDFERVNKKFEELMQDGDIQNMEKKLENLNNKPNPDSIDEIWIQMYTDVLELKKNKVEEDLDKED